MNTYMKSLLALCCACALASIVHADPRVEPRSPVDSIEQIKAHEWPNLGTNYKLIGEPTKQYNCIAWVIGETQKWVWPGERLEDFDRLFGGEGFRRIPQLDYRQVDGIDKIVLYGLRGPGRVTCTHAARQMQDGSWTNKLGAMPLIDVADPGRMAGPTYGAPIAVYVRGQVAGPGNGNYVRIVNVMTGKCISPLRVPNAFDQAVQLPYTGSPSQHWRVERLADGTHRIVNRMSRAALDVLDGKQQSGTPLNCFPYHGGKNQHWILDRVGDYHRITSPIHGKVLDLSWGNQANGTQIVLWPFSGDKNQLWELRPVK